MASRGLPWPRLASHAHTHTLTPLPARSGLLPVGERDATDVSGGLLCSRQLGICCSRASKQVLGNVLKRLLDRTAHQEAPSPQYLSPGPKGRSAMDGVDFGRIAAGWGPVTDAKGVHTAAGTRGKRMAEGRAREQSQTSGGRSWMPPSREAPRHDKQNLKSIRNGQGSLGQFHQLTSTRAPSRRCNLRRKAPSNEPGCWPCCVDTPARRSNHQIVRLIFNGLGSTGTGCSAAGQPPRASKRMR